MAYLLIKRDALRVDGWTYGDWRQYVAFRDDGEASIVRLSDMPPIMASIGWIVLVIVAMAVLMMGTKNLNWPNLFWLTSTAFLLLAPATIEWLTNWRLTVIVGEAKRMPDGGWERVL